MTEAAGVRKVAMSVAFFCASSLGAVFVNKACLTHFRFSHPFALMLMQLIFTFVMVSLASGISPRFAPAAVKRADLPRLLLPSVLLVGNISVGLFALTLVNIPMFSAFRRLTVLFVMGAEFVMLRKVHSGRVVFAVFILTSGAFVSALGDATFTALGYTLVLINNILTATYLASIKRVMADLSIAPYTLLYYMAGLSIFPVLVLAVVTGDLAAAVEDFISRPDLHNSPLFIPALSVVAASALCVNLATSMCTNVTSPLTTAVAGQIKNVLQTVLGFFSWGYVPTPLNLFGLIVALVGQVCFGYFKYIESKAASPHDDSSGAFAKVEKAVMVAQPDDDDRPLFRESSGPNSEASRDV